MDLAFDILVRAAGLERRLGRMVIRRDGRPVYFWESGYEGPMVRAVDVILRSSVEAARKTVDITEIWDGELVYPSVVHP
jgi:hypothetical protein